MYNVGADMLMNIRGNLGNDAFYEVLADSRLLVPYWQKTQN